MPPQPASPKRAPPSPPTKRKHAGDYVKKCEHCHTTESPEWRRGPTGPKTLCNACGLRYARNIAKLDTVAHGILAASASSSAALGGRGGGEGL
ncbi:GATA zinc finger-domain-containing protein [Chytridium lagenaria]|nr:GATA zinc finger-domain-containing protein [Chytridium lagenaria]